MAEVAIWAKTAAPRRTPICYFVLHKASVHPWPFPSAKLWSKRSCFARRLPRTPSPEVHKRRRPSRQDLHQHAELRVRVTSSMSSGRRLPPPCTHTDQPGALAAGEHVDLPVRSPVQDYGHFDSQVARCPRRNRLHLRPIHRLPGSGSRRILCRHAEIATFDILALVAKTGVSHASMTATCVLPKQGPRRGRIRMHWRLGTSAQANISARPDHCSTKFIPGRKKASNRRHSHHSDHPHLTPPPHLRDPPGSTRYPPPSTPHLECLARLLLKGAHSGREGLPAQCRTRQRVTPKRHAGGRRGLTLTSAVPTARNVRQRPPQEISRLFRCLARFAAEDKDTRLRCIGPLAPIRPCIASVPSIGRTKRLV